MLKATLLILVTSYFAWHLERFETAIVYPFDATYQTPDAAGEPRLVEERVRTEDGEELIVWRANAAPGRPTVLYLPGNAGGLRDRAERFARLIDHGFGVTALAYRGSSGSTGRPEELALTDDAMAVALGETATPLVLYGESLGTALAIKLAASGLGDAVVLEAPFTSIIDLVRSQHPYDELDHLITQRWESIGRVAGLRQPLLVLHGANDRLVPVRMGRAIFENAGSREKRFVEIAGRGHSDLWTAEAQRALYAFLDSL